MHEEQMDFCWKIKKKFPNHFRNKKVLDVGSLDVNGTNERFFQNCNYIGLDIAKGPNVDVVSLGHLYDAPDESFETIISTECFEHDMYYKETWKNIIRLLKPGGMFLFTCAAPGRFEHGTARTRPEDSPLTAKANEEWSNYYHNITGKELEDTIDLAEVFQNYDIEEYHKILVGPFRTLHDLYFWGIKKDKNE